MLSSPTTPSVSSSAVISANAPSMASSATVSAETKERHAIIQPIMSPVRQALGLIRWYLGSGPAGSYRVEDLEWYEIPMSCSQWETLRIILDAYDDDRQYDSSVP